MFTYETDKQTLLEFKSQVSKGKRAVLSSWNNSFPLCKWTWVKCGKKHKRVTGLNLGGLQLGGVISPSIGNLSFLISLNLTSNGFGGTIPQELGSLFRLKHLFMSFNFLKGEIPTSLFNCSRLVELHLHSNSLSQVVPWELGSLRKLVLLDLGRNNLKGKFPASLGNLTSLEELSFVANIMEGEIPNDIARLANMVDLQLATNNFSGVFPQAIYNMSLLENLNIIDNGFFGSLRNINLCGGVLELKLKPCKHSSFSKKVLIGISVGVSALLVLFIAFVSLCWFRNRKRNKTNEASPSTLGTFHEQISYGDLRNATNGFSSSNLVGSGCFGTVFKALIPPENKVVAVKVLNLQQRGALKSFMAECESLKNVRHRNLVKLLTACSSIDFQGNQFRALIYEFMPNGSLDMWLHPDEEEEIRRPSRTLTLLERLNIAIDVAYVLDYLHIHSHEAIAHCDLKPSNVLLDEDLTAHVSDFGLAQILLKFDQEYFLNQLSSAGVRGTIGYAAPEYGMGGQVSTHGDMYSFGILLLEMFSGKRPTNELFGGNFTLYSYIESALPGRVLDVADEVVLHCLKLVFEVGLRCCEEYPVNRLAMGEALKELITIREKFFRSKRRARH
ncbi:hypothetical protein F2Q69_00041785 [Brassica cretica]|uniref:non-specific serine/threonine protein kinase n=1 Tax=Brassica cretica TaxID=69181 RepID=A0A8S9NBZ8_BRACR|nr:hypothetical protein F2Q69_00041785 [Brassica cretica]